jgi:hypothetical protein
MYYHIKLFSLFTGMIANDYCNSVTTAISKAEMLFPQFGAAETECQKNTDKLMLGNSLLFYSHFIYPYSSHTS